MKKQIKKRPDAVDEAYEAWIDTLVIEETIAFGFRSRHCRDVVKVLGQTVFFETYFPFNPFNQIFTLVKAVDFHIRESDPIMKLAKQYGAIWEPGYYAKEGYGWPVWRVSEYECRDCFRFLTDLKRRLRRRRKSATSHPQ